MHPITAAQLVTVHQAELLARAEAQRAAAHLRRAGRAPTRPRLADLLDRALAAGRRSAPSATTEPCAAC